MEKWLDFQFSTGVYTGEDYNKFQAAAKRSLKKIANGSGFDLHTFSGNHYNFSAVLRHRESDRFIYVSISDVRFWPNEWYHHVLIRMMAHDKDWTGGHNHYCKWPEIGKTALWLLK